MVLSRQRARDGSANVSLNGSWSALSEAGEATNLNLVHLAGYDCTNAEDLTRAEMQGRREVQHALRALRHALPGFERAKLRNYAMTLGVRDSRKIVGRHNLSAADVALQGRFDDSIATLNLLLRGGGGGAGAGVGDGRQLARRRPPVALVLPVLVVLLLRVFSHMHLS